MTDTFHEQVAPTDEAADLRRHARLRRFSALVTTVLFLLCTIILLLGIWASGVTLDGLFRTPDVFNASRDICLRSSWHKVSGVQQPVELCYEWINLADSSGSTHTFQQDMDVVLGADGKLHYKHGEGVDARVTVLLVCIGVVIAFGVWLKRLLIARYRRQLDGQAN